jgi:8-oxo-dGTP pyrophosphatase MutT (NUDIX family)
VGKRGIEFLLVRTRGGRWIFPKGGVERHLTHAQSAALEAYEEAGVHGRIETLAFARYFKSSPALASSPTTRGRRTEDSPVPPEPGVLAHLCEVSRLEKTQEANRNPTWFSVEKTRQRLLKGRNPGYGAELARVVDRAVSRIHRLYNSAHDLPHRAHRDGLHKVRFEAHEDLRLHDDLRQALLARYVVREPGAESRKLSRFGVRLESGIGAHGAIGQPALRLNTGANSGVEPNRKVTAIDSGRRANRPPLP